ncbi:cobalt-precorrin-5B (C(1))-methyltransferase CbiD [Picrophilus oshimae]|uniref:Cobalt-precorrin-5B C(1)-methyltransferase n=1 Tax=Picrophilus torridus (strain ATCC 700027 / DSM 9790 / JCM 10055 / NBRC 100828 / KAW 2/3) TaxID=1122961 RepID=CBID_PICTO|nr:cobalt-precorrin-5B (C(1))-methyltransferase CbiD [Picrophilus oshimae]Q3V8B2.1 RecName: Full=Cobalt-precorrin-5B C(1)-methyltransferase; AltName: Full=Cobalt-precorrin-6A synthase [Picrophilus oshimae DSM 9789]AAT42695.1 cobalamin biosynthetic protein CbiD [Picrophilus oshimae DSM 9789]
MPRYGYTTGTCATAATRAAIIALATGRKLKSVEVKLPSKKNAIININDVEIKEDYAMASVVKDGGDDPDVTTGLVIYSKVSFTDSGIYVDGGEGIGRVTKEGLPVKPGNAAINPVPMRMIKNTAMETLSELNISSGLKIIISAPGGDKVALKTCNPKLGIIGGISILGTTGIVVPYSAASWRASIVLAMRVAIKSNYDTVILTTGSRTEEYARKLFNDRYPCIDVGDFIGFSIRRAAENGIKNIIIACMPGKASKLAMGMEDTSSRNSGVDFDFIYKMALSINIKNAEIIKNSNTVNALVDEFTDDGLFKLMAELAKINLRRISNINIDVIIFDMSGNVIS